MKLSRRSLLVRWAYLLSDWGIPHETNLCTLFWRATLLTPLKFLGIAAGVTLLVLGLIVAPVAVLGWWGLAVVPLGVGVIVGSPYAVGGVKRSTFGTVVRTGIHGIKHKYCPRITLE